MQPLEGLEQSLENIVLATRASDFCMVQYSNSSLAAKLAWIPGQNILDLLLHQQGFTDRVLLPKLLHPCPYLGSAPDWQELSGPRVCQEGNYCRPKAELRHGNLSTASLP